MPTHHAESEEAACLIEAGLPDSTAETSPLRSRTRASRFLLVAGLVAVGLVGAGVLAPATLKRIHGNVKFALGLSDVLDTSDNDFQSMVSDKEIVLVEFFAPWDGHCKRLAPEYEKAATALIKNDPPVHLAKVDCTEAGKDACSKHGVSGYPTLKIFRGGEMSQDYDGPRDSLGITNYMKKQAGPSMVEIRSQTHFEKVVDGLDERLLVMGFFTEECDAKNRLGKAAGQLRGRGDFEFAYTLEAAKYSSDHKDGAIVLMRPKHLRAKFEPPEKVLDDLHASTLDIVDFIKKNAPGLVGQLLGNSEDLFKAPVITAYYRIDWKNNPKGASYIRYRVARVAKKFEDKITFSVADSREFDRRLGDLGFADDDAAVRVVARNARGQRFKMEGDWSVASLEQFANDFEAGNLEPYIKSEPVPEFNDGSFKVVVGSTFEDIVMDPTKDTLLVACAPWSGHCKSLMPKMQEVADRLACAKDLVISKIDATANDLPPGYTVSGFPTIYFAPMGGKDEPRKYSGGWEQSDIIDFIKREATNPVETCEKKKKKKKGD